AMGVTRTASGDLYISDPADARVRKVGTDGVISTVAGTGFPVQCGDGGPATQACLFPISTAVDVSGRLYIADQYNETIRRINLDGTISTVAGKPAGGVVVFCPRPDDGLLATPGCLNPPWDVALDPAGNVYLTESSGFRVRKVDTSGVIHTVAGNGAGAFCGDGGPATAACVSGPRGLAFDPTGNLLVSATNPAFTEGRIRQIDPAGTTTTVAGHGPITYFGTAVPAPAACLAPDRFAIDAAGRTYIADPVNRVIWVMTPPA